MHIALRKLVFGLCVTRVTNDARSIDEDGGSIRTVGIVAIGALLLVIGFMSRCQLQARLLDLLVTRKTQLPTNGVQKLIVPSCMRCVTGKAAVVALYRLVRITHCRTRIIVARKAELVTRLDQQRRRFGGMRIMTVQAGPIFERPVLHVTGYEEVHGIVTIGAEFPVLRSRIKSILGIGGVVAGLAFASEYRVMDARPQQGGQRRRMGIVAGRALPLFYRVTGVRRFEGGVIAFMARNAELCRCHGEQIRLCRGVCAMALPAAVIFNPVVHDVARIILLLVTLEADRTPLGAQQIRRIRCVRIVARYAGALLEGRVYSLGVESEIFGAVTFETDLVAFLLQQELTHNAVSKVAIFALAILHDFVNIRHRKILPDVFFVTIQTFFAFEFSLLRVRRGREARQRDAEA
jgi:hypothetical protein